MHKRVTQSQGKLKTVSTHDKVIISRCIEMLMSDKGGRKVQQTALVEMRL